MHFRTYFIDTFTSTPSKGNPTGVCYIKNESLTEQSMLDHARELNFPVTAFISKKSNTTAEYNIQYFTPTTEIPACGHATLAAAKVVFMEDDIQQVVFHTIDRIAIHAVADRDLIMMTYPKYDLQPCNISQELLSSLQLKEYKAAGYCPQLEALFIEMHNPADLRSVQPHYEKLVAANNEIKEVVITSVADSDQYDYLLRSFCPWIGIDEDPVTGSVHSVLAGFWKERLHKTRLKAYQASERGGELVVNAFDSKVEIGGNCVIIYR